MVRTGLLSYRGVIEGNRKEVLEATDWGFTNLRDPEAIYYMARNVAAIGENELALTQLKRSLDGGYVFYRALVREDPFLDPVRATPEFQELVERLSFRVYARGVIGSNESWRSALGNKSMDGRVGRHGEIHIGHR